MLQESSPLFMSWNSAYLRKYHLWTFIVLSFLTSLQGENFRFLFHSLSSSLTNPHRAAKRETWGDRRICVPGTCSFNNPLCHWPLELSSRVKQRQLWRVLTLLFFASALKRNELFYWKWMSQGRLSKCQQVCLWVCVGHWVSKWVSWSRVHEYPALCEQHLACGCTLGFQDVGMHTSASAMRSALPATDLRYNDTWTARLQRKCVGHCHRRCHFLILSLPPSHSFPLFHYEG